MAVKIGDVTIRIGATTAQLEADLRKAERALSASSKRFTDFGTKMTLGLTVPIAAAGAAALQSFGDFERLQNALIAITGDASIAAEQFERLKVIAEAPGLALPQVVKASASLQAVGLSAQQAEETIKQYGNAVARSGGGAAEFDGAVLALTQIASKGKISAEELNQLGERIFEIRPALQAAFGTSNSEELQKLGISAQDFIARTTAELGKLERVQGGLSNSFENFRDSVQGSLATLGKAISDSIDFPAILNGISDAIKSVTNAFNDLSPEQKRFAVVLAGVTALIGPATAAYGFLLKTYGLLRIEYIKQVAAVLAKAKADQVATVASGVATKTTVGFTIALRAALATVAPYVLAIGALVGIAYAISKNMDDATASTIDYNQVREESLKSIATEINQSENLIKVINDETKSKEDKKKALDGLIALSPEYFKGLTTEKDDIKKINEQYTDYVTNLKKAAFARAAQGQQDQIAINILNEENALRQLRAKQARQEADAAAQTARLQKGLSREGTNLAQNAVDATQREINARILKIGVLSKESDALSEIINKNSQVVTPKKTDTGGGGPEVDLTPFQKSLKNINDELAEVDKLFKAGLITGSEASEQKLKLLEDRLKLLVTNGFNPTSQAVLGTKNEIQNLQNELGQQFASVDIVDNLSKQFTNLDNQLKVGTITSFQATSEKVQLLTAEMQRLKDEGVSPASAEFTKLTDKYAELATEQDGIVKNIGALVTGVKDLSDPLQLLADETLTELNKQITLIQEKTAAGLISQSDADVERINAIKTALNSLIEQGLGGTDAAAKLQEQLKGAESSVKTTYTNIFDFLGNKIASLPGIAEKLGENVQTLGPKIGKAFEGAVAAVQQVFSTFGAFFDMQEAKIDQFEEKEKERIANSIMGEEAKEAALANLNEKVLKKRKALARKQAALDKASALFSATIAGANAVLQALAVPLIGPVLAKITAGLVAAQLAFIAATPLPSLAIGTDLVKSDGLAMIHKGEAIVPADVAKGGFNGSGGMAQVSGRIQGTDIILVSDYAMNFKNRIR